MPILLKQDKDDPQSEGITQHWCLSSINLKEQKIIVYDSKHSNQSETNINTVLRPFISYYTHYIQYNNSLLNQGDEKPVQRGHKFNGNDSTTGVSSDNLTNDYQSIVPTNDDKCEILVDTSIFDSEQSSVCSDLNQSIIDFEIEDPWKFKLAKVPQQNNKFDGGIFICKFMDYLSRNEPITFSHEDIAYYRVSLGIELAIGRLLAI